MRCIRHLTSAAIVSGGDVAHVELCASCTDNTVWHLDVADLNPRWQELPPIPSSDSKYLFPNGSERDPANPGFGT